MAPKYSLAELRNLLDDDELDLSASAITDFPREIVKLTRLTKLDMSSNQLCILPDIVCKMTKIVRLDFGSNRLDHLPEDIGLLVNLQHLSLYNNKIFELPMSFGNLKSLKWLDLKKNPLNPELAATAGNCGTEAECRFAARQVINNYMPEKKRKFEILKAQEAKMINSVQQAIEDQLKKKYKEKKLLEQQEKEAKHREAAKAAHQPAPKVEKVVKNPSVSPKKSPKKEEKPQEKPRGFIRKLFSFIWSVIFYLTVALATSSTIAIGLDCKGMGTPIPGNAPLCKDLGLIFAGNKPSAAFGNNVKNAYGKVLRGYHTQLKPHVEPMQKSVSAQWKKFAKSDVGGKVEKVLIQIHTFIVDKWVKVQRFVVAQWTALNKWWEKDGKKKFGPTLDGIVIGMKMVYNVVVDVLRNVAAVFVHLATRVKVFVNAWIEGGFNAAMNTLNR